MTFSPSLKSGRQPDQTQVKQASNSPAPLSVCIIGAANLDVLACGADPQVFIRRTMPLEAIEMQSGGDAMNEASALGLLGANVRLKTLLGNDMAGDLIRQLCRQRNIRLDNLSTAWKTSVNIVLIEPDGERCFLTGKETSMRHLTRDMLQVPQEEIVCLASLFVSWDLPVADAADCMREWKRHGKITAMDTTTAKHGEGMEEMKEILPYVDFFFTNEREAASITGLADAEASLEQLIQAGAGHILLKLGAKGVLVYDGKRTYFKKADSIASPLDTTGCGDGFAAGFLYGISQHQSFEVCLDIAMFCGRAVCQAMGASSAFEDGQLVQIICSRITEQSGEKEE